MIAALLLAALAQEWQFDPDRGFVHPASGRVRTVAEFLADGEGFLQEGKPAEAHRVFAMIMASRAGGAGVQEAAHFGRARAQLEAGRPFQAYHDFELFVRRYAQSDRANGAKRLEMEAALQLAERGHPKSVFGVALFSTATTGVELLKRALRRYPRETFSAEYVQKLGMFFYDRGDLDAAEVEFATVVETYEDASVFVLALYMLARVREQRFDGIDYDLKPLREARRQYRRFIEEADRLRKLPAPAAQWVDDYMASVKERLARIHEIMAEKELQTAAYYESKGYPRAAALYWKAIVAEYPETKAAAEARARMGDDAADPAAPTEPGDAPR